MRAFNGEIERKNCLKIKLSFFYRRYSLKELTVTPRRAILRAMNSLEERLAFSERLRQALGNANYSPSSPTKLAREFNHRFQGQPVTVHAARKWLHGESIPTQEKLRALASWLDVPADWLRFGNEGGKNKGQASQFSSMEARLLANLQQLDDHDRQLAHELLRLLIRMNKKK